MPAVSKPPVGSRPGVLAIPHDSPPPIVRVFDYDEDQFAEIELDEFSDFAERSSSNSTTWVDIQGLGDEAVLLRIADHFGIHRLALADAVNSPQRPKADAYDDHLTIIGRAPLPSEDPLEEIPQVCILLSDTYVITFQERYFGFFDAVRDRIRTGAGDIRKAGPCFLAYSLLDSLVDHYYPAVEGLSERLEELEDGLLDAPTPDRVTRLHELRRQITALRRVARPQREALYRLIHDPNPFVRDETRLFLRDAHDHASQVLELLDSSREMAGDLMDAALALLSHKSNEVMKVLTLMASIFIPLTFIAGIYGMNFDDMPELHHPAGYPAVLVAMGAAGVGMVLFFRRRGWLGNGENK